MLKLINRIFVYTYTWQYERNYNNPNIDPTRIASWVLGLWVGLLLVSIDCVFSFIFKYDFKSILFVIGIGAVSLITAGLFNRYYIEKNRAINLYEQYKSSFDLKSPINGILIVIFFMLSPLILLVLFILIFNLLVK